MRCFKRNVNLFLTQERLKKYWYINCIINVHYFLQTNRYGTCTSSAIDTFDNNYIATIEDNRYRYVKNTQESKR